MGDLDHKQKDKKKQDADERKRRSDIDDQDGAGDGTHLLPWDADVEDFLERLELLLNGHRTAMTSTEFRSIVADYRELSPSEKRAVANRLQKRGLGNLVRALHAGDFRLYKDTWQADADAIREAEAPRPEPDPASGGS